MNNNYFDVNGNRFYLMNKDDKWNVYKVKWASGNELVSVHDTRNEAVVSVWN